MNIGIFIAFGGALFAIALIIIALTHDRRYLRAHRKQLVLATALMAALGPIGELFVGWLYASMFGHPLWIYQLWPIHHGYTSLIAPIIWGVGGLELAVMSAYLKQLVARWWVRHALLAIDIMMVEVIINISCRLLTGYWIFYYFPGDLWHVSSLQTLPFYLIAGAVFTRSLRNFSTHAYTNALLWIAISMIVVFLTR